MILAPSNTILTRAQAGYLVSNQAFGTWNGTATSANLVNALGAVPNTARAVNIYRNDWQGQQLLFPTLRQQYLDSTAPGGPGWGSTGSPTITLNAATDPAGTTLATKIVTTAVSYIYRFPTYGTPPQPSAGTLTEYVWLKGGAGGENFYVGCDQSGATDGLVNVVLTTSRARYPAIFAWSDVGSLDIVLAHIPAGVTIYAAFAQIEKASAPGSFIAGSVGTFPTLTDYTLSGTTVNLAQAPTSTATTNATFYAT